jgi:hypothetical protein
MQGRREGVLQMQVAVEAGPNISVIQGRKSIEKIVSRQSIVLCIDPCCAMSWLTSSSAIESRLAFWTGNEARIIRGQLAILAGVRYGQARSPEDSAKGQTSEADCWSRGDPAAGIPSS